MPWRDALEPVRMERVAVVATGDALQEVLALVAEAGVLEPDLTMLERGSELPSGGVELGVDDVCAATLQRNEVAALAGWIPATMIERLARALEPLGATLVRLPLPADVQPPTLVPPSGPASTFQPLVDTYATVPYDDINPSVLAGLAYVAMFGMMFGDVGHGVLLLAAGLFLRLSRRPLPSYLRKAAPFVIGCGVTSTAFGFAFGEAFGPTHLAPVLWLAPLDHATELLAVAVAIGAVLIAASYVLGTVNRWREGGATQALLAVSGIAGAGMYLGLALVGLGWYRHLVAAELGGAVVALIGVVLGFAGLYAEAGGRAAGVAEATVEMFDSVIRLGTNTVSFARLAAFGLTHAALTGIVWQGTTALWHKGGLMTVLGAVLFLAGNAFTFALEGLVAAIQALRLEYYELFSRVFSSQGRSFRPWHISKLTPKEASCSLG
jgi:V/A-type H+-transporting ATPase subunit I